MNQTPRSGPIGRWSTFSLVAIMLLAASAEPLYSAVRIAVSRSGAWSDPLTWNINEVPHNNTADTFIVHIDGGDASDSTVYVQSFEEFPVNELHISAGDTLRLDTRSRLRVVNGVLNNDGWLTFGEGASETPLVLHATTTIEGGGVIDMSDNVFNGIVGLPDTELTIGGLQTVRGAGSISGHEVINDGLIEAIHTNNPLLLSSNAGWTNNGILQGRDGGNLVIHYTQLDNTDGQIIAQPDSYVVIGNSAVVEGGQLQSYGTGHIRAGSGVLKNLVNAAHIRLLNADALSLQGTITNSGTISMEAGVSDTVLWINEAVTLESAQFTLSDSGWNRLRGSGTAPRLTNPAGSTLAFEGGRGQLGTDSLALTNAGTLEANGNHDLVIDPTGSSVAVNSGTLRAMNGAHLQLNAAEYDNTGGVIEALDASTIQLNGNVVITGGTLRTLDTSGFTCFGARLQDLTLDADVAFSYNTLYLGGTIYAAGGQIRMGTWSDLRIVGATTIAGGEIHFADTGNSTIRGIAADDAFIIPAGQTVRFTGETGNLGAGFMTLTNEGTLVGEGVTGLTVDALSGSNSGFIQASNGGVVSLVGIGLNNTGGTIRAFDGSTVYLSTAAMISGGALDSVGSGAVRTYGATLRNVTNQGELWVPSYGGFQAEGSLTNQGTIHLDATSGNADLVINGSVALAGTGLVRTSNHVNNRIRGANGDDVLTIEAEQIFRGAGHVGLNSLSLINRGTIEADQTNILSIDPPDTGTFTNEGTLRAIGSGGLSIASGPFATQGVVEIGAASRLFRQGDYTQTAGLTVVDGVLQTAGGVVDIEGGWLTGTGTIIGGVSNSATLAPGNSLGILTSHGFTQTAEGTLEIEIGGTATAGDDYDQLVVNGPATLDGMLQVRLVGDYQGPTLPGERERVTVLTSASRTDEFDPLTADERSLGGGLFYAPIYVGDNVQVELFRTAAGDADGDGTVDVSDFNVWNANKFTHSIEWTDGDFNQDGVVDASDFNVWNANKFTSVIGPGAVPEPTAWWLLAGGLAAIGARISRSRSEKFH